MNADALLEGDYIKAVEFGDKLPTNPTYTIVAINIETMPNIRKPGKETNKGVVMFSEIPRGWVMNRTNVECLKALFGPDTENWLRHRVTLGTEPTKTGPGIRVIGSPDITRDVIAEWTPPRQKKQVKRLIPTGTAPGGKGPMSLQDFRGWIGNALKHGWTPEQVAHVIGGKSAEDVAPEDRRGLVATLKGTPVPLPAPPGDTPPDADQPPHAGYGADFTPPAPGEPA